MIEKSDHFVFVPVEGRHQPVMAFCAEKLNPSARDEIREKVLSFHTKMPPGVVWEFWLDGESKAPKLMSCWHVG